MTLACKAQELFTVSGTVQMVSYSQGGVELPPEEYMPHPLPNTQLYVVAFYGADEKSKIVTTLQSDQAGRFEIQLPPGKYGIIQHKSELGKGVFLPGMNLQQDTMDKKELVFTGYDQQDYWVLSSNGPFEVVNMDLTQLNITHYNISICYMCP